MKKLNTGQELGVTTWDTVPGNTLIIAGFHMLTAVNFCFMLQRFQQFLIIPETRKLYQKGLQRLLKDRLVSPEVLCRISSEGSVTFPLIAEDARAKMVRVVSCPLETLEEATWPITGNVILPPELCGTAFWLHCLLSNSITLHTPRISRAAGVFEIASNLATA